MELFGFELKRKNPEPISFAPKTNDDGAVVVAEGGVYGTYVDLDGSIRTEAELVNKYREMSYHPEIDRAVDDIVNEVVTQEPESEPVELILDDVELSDRIKKLFIDEFKNVLKLLEFNAQGYELFKRWYVDGRLYYHVILDESAPKDGIIELRYIDPRKIRKVREVKRKKLVDNVPTSQTSKEYYIYNDKGFSKTSGNVSSIPNNSIGGVKIARDSIVHNTSGLTSINGDLVQSYLHKAIKPLNQLRSMEDSLVIYRISRAPERRIFYIDVGNLPKMKAEQYLRDQMTRFKNKLVYDSASGEVRDDRKFMCYSMDTKIPLLDGRTLELQEIIKEFNEGKQNWVYSCDPITGKFYPGPVSWAGITKTNAAVVRVTFDNGKSVVCTPDHKFPVWNKGFVEAQHLTPEDSIIPGYRRTKTITNNSKVQYEQIYLNDTQTWEFTHREISKWKESVNLRSEFVYDKSLGSLKKNVVHHSDFNSLNNNPENLVMMNHLDHIKFHKENQSVLYTDQILDLFKFCAQNLMDVQTALNYINCNIDFQDWIYLNKNSHVKNRDMRNLIFTSKDIYRLTKLQGYKTWNKYLRTFDFRERENNGRIKRGNTVPKYSEAWKQKLSIAAKAKTKSPTSKTWKIVLPSGEIEIIENLNKYCRENNLNRNTIKNNGSKGHKAEILRNHRITSVEFLEEKLDVGSMSIDANETYHSHHTYLLDAGVYTKNTMLEDFWLPRREGKGTEITTLPGGQNLGQIDDIVYFQKKLYQALNVPVSRLDTETQFGFGRSNEITRDEVKFSKFVNRLRNRFATLFTKILEKQLILKSIITYEEWELLKNQIRYKFAQDNYFAELKETEILRDRITMLRDIDDYAAKYYSHEWIRRHVLRQTDEEMEEIDKQIAEEANNPQYSPPMPEQPAPGEQQQPEQTPEPVGSQGTLATQGQ